VFVPEDHDTSSHLNRQCVDCGERDPAVLEIDHPADIAEFPSSEITLRDWQTTPTILSDFEVVCVSCHLRRARSRGPVGELLRCWRNR
jgi:hypothetical protein